MFSFISCGIISLPKDKNPFVCDSEGLGSFCIFFICNILSLVFWSLKKKSRKTKEKSNKDLYISKSVSLYHMRYLQVFNTPTKDFCVTLGVAGVIGNHKNY